MEQVLLQLGQFCLRPHHTDPSKYIAIRRPTAAMEEIYALKIFSKLPSVRWDVEDQQWILSHDPKCGHHTVGLKGFFQEVKLCRKYIPEEALAMERPVFSLSSS